MQRIRRSVEKNMAELKALQPERKAAIAEAEEKARLLVQLAEYEAQHGRSTVPFALTMTKTTTNPPGANNAPSPALRSPQSASAVFARKIGRSKLLQSPLGVSF